MGATNYREIITAADDDQLKKVFNYMRSEYQLEYGRNAYSGTLATLTGIQVVKDPYPNAEWSKIKEQKVEDYLLKRAEKWQDALAVKMDKQHYFVVAWLAT